ncbi:MAG: anthranilate synthase component I family protein [Nocardioides marinisabuli]|uniref:anthranilate synthase component I family protein n=1 Tax=Nocardioides marinisabuli TaxID=419476 RepID=UPI003219F3D8
MSGPPSDPVAVFEQVAATHERCFWLDGGGAREWSGRRSILGWCEPDDVSLTYDAGRREVTRHSGGRAEVVGDDVFAVLEAELGAGGPADQWFGHLGYACRPDLPARPSLDVPDAVWMRPSHVRFFEHPDMAAGPGGLETVAAPPPRPASAAYRAAFAEVQERLHAGDTYEVNLTLREEVVSGLDPVAAYLRLRALNPAPYAGFLQHDVAGARGWLLSSSPERYALVGADRVLETKPIKGTAPRGADAASDAALRERLAGDPKQRAENLMVVDLLRNDVAGVCEPGSVQVPTLMEVETYASLHQLVSVVRGRLREEVTTVGALRALFPAGSMTGAPKLRTMEVIDAVEASPRGAYAGAFGWLSADGRADLGVVIRALSTRGDGTWRLGTGGGVTVLSEVEDEWAEARLKADRLLAVFDA